jgi:hypothetical protein
MRVIEGSSRKRVLKARLRFDIYGIITDGSDYVLVIAFSLRPFALTSLHLPL